MNIQENSFILRFKKYMSSPYSGQIVFLLILLYVLSIFFLEITLVPNRITLLCMFVFSILSYLYHREPLRLRLRDLYTQLFFILPLFFFIVNGCNDRVLMLNIVIPLLLLILGSKFFSSTRIIVYLYKSLNISICIIFFLCLTSVLLKLSDRTPEYWWNSFVHKSFVEILNQHPSYVSMLVLVAINGNLERLYRSILENKVIGLSLGVFALNLTFLVLLSSKMAYLILVVLFALFVVRLIVANKLKWVGGILFVFVVLISVLYYTLPSIKDRITVDYRTFASKNFVLDNNSPASERIHIWRTSIMLIEENPFGRFCIDTKEQIWSRLDKTNKEELVEKNAHNNFLEFGLRYGVLGIIVLFLFVLVCFYFFIKYKDFLFLGVLLIFLLFSLTESTLFREMGVIYMAFIFQLHLLNLKKPVR
ncbi:O-antigen ligase [Zobellia uliginosa]|uniref:O-antigen ligase n=1 Tax=Zobellia uliginosa TaxID=143224 RepID=A0ABY1KI85_9FLAO|nr:O-antigen ligase family protein [Zobellia uliginosa]SIS38205.1 O-antigen ligase [Zobellia uliginosa]